MSNLNTLWHKETVDAISCDPVISRFTCPTQHSVWTEMEDIYILLVGLFFQKWFATYAAETKEINRTCIRKRRYLPHCYSDERTCLKGTNEGSFKSPKWSLFRYTIWIPLYPIGFICEGVIALRNIPYFEETEQFSVLLPNR